MRKSDIGLKLLLAVFLVTFTVTSVQASVVRVELDDSLPIYAGEPFAVHVLADVGSFEVVAFGFNLLWDSDDVTFLELLIPSPFLDTSSAFEDIDVAGGINPFDGEGVATGDDLLLATLFFEADAVGNTTIGIATDLSELSTLNEGLFFPCPTPRMDMSSDLDVKISAIPLPAAVWMLGSGLGALVFLRRRG